MSEDPLGALGGEGFDMNALLQQAQQMGEQLMATQQEAESQIYEGQAGGGAVKIGVTGGFEFQSVSISPAAVNADDVEMLEDLVLAALNDAISQMGQHQGGGGGLGALDIGDLLGGGDLGKMLGSGDE